MLDQLRHRRLDLWRKGGKGELEEWRARPHSPRMGASGLRSEAVHYIRGIVVR